MENMKKNWSIFVFYIFRRNLHLFKTRIKTVTVCEIKTLSGKGRDLELKEQTHYLIFCNFDTHTHRHTHTHVHGNTTLLPYDWITKSSKFHVSPRDDVTYKTKSFRLHLRTQYVKIQKSIILTTTRCTVWNSFFRFIEFQSL